jgi:glycosyltransferase involved in cell wall biosynthesis
MRIAQVAPLTEAVPPRQYGGIERVVSFLTEELVSMGHEVTLFASGDSATRAKLAAGWPRAMRFEASIRDTFAPHMVMIEQVARRADEFDVVHSHLDYWPFSLFSRLNKPFLTTLHGRLDMAELAAVYRCFDSVPLVSISEAQRRPLAQVNFVKTIHHGIPEDLLTPKPVKQEYAAFLGRVSPEKGVDKAIRIAGKAGLKLKIAAKVDNADKKYYETEIRPLIQASPWVEFIGEINDAQKPDFLSGAHALLFPIDWPEPFGLAMIESMACGTPVIAFNCGSVPEVIEHGVTGFVVDDEVQAIAAILHLGRLSRKAIRQRFEERFTAQRMAMDYLSLYRHMAVKVRPNLRVVT